MTYHYDAPIHKLTGKERDWESNLDDFEARYYSSQLGRFMSADPDGREAANPGYPQTWNMYSYVRNNPLNATDPDGLDCIYTSNQTSNSVDVTIVRGDCLSDTDNRVYVNGTVISAVATAGVGKAAETVVQGAEVSEAAAEGAAVTQTVAKEGIYEFTASSGKTYVGQSGDIATRLDQHLASGKLLPGDVSTVKTTEVLGGKTAREVAEQQRINQLGGVKNLENVRNPIGPARQHLLKKAVPQ